VHRTTRDIDLFWHGRSELGSLPADVAARLRADGLVAEVLQTSRNHHRLRVVAGDQSVVLDLIAETVPAIELPRIHHLGSASIQVDTPHEILVNKLCALLGRSEIRDLQDVASLLSRGGDLELACADAPRKDAGFSPLTLSWVLRDFPVRKLSTGAGIGSADADELERFRADLTNRLLTLARPEKNGP
jgi:hypothetical protein